MVLDNWTERDKSNRKHNECIAFCMVNRELRRIVATQNEKSLNVSEITIYWKSEDDMNVAPYPP
jgi:hypothetical protein